MGHRLVFSKAVLAWLVSLSAIAPLLRTPDSAAAIASQADGPVSSQEVSAAEILATSTDSNQLSAQRLAQIDLQAAESLVLPGYVLGEDSFQFSNADLTRAIQANRTRPDWISSFTLTLSQLFGSQVCVGQDTERCILTAAAQNWLTSQMDLMALGICDGMAAASLFLREPEPEPVLPWWQRLLTELTPFSGDQVAASDSVLQTFVANQALLQGLDEVYLPTQQIRESLTPREILAQLVNALRNDPDNPYTIGVYRQQAGQLLEGHTLLPYRVEADQNGQYRVYVFDSNLPSESREEPYLLFDVEADTWSYEPAGSPSYKGDAQSKNLDLTQLSWRLPQGSPLEISDPSEFLLRGPFTCPFCGAERHNQSLEVALIGEGVLSVQQLDEVTGEYQPVTGQEAHQVPFKGGLDRAVPASYSVSADGSDRPFKITVTGTTSQVQDDLSLQIFGPGYTAGFEELQLGPQETLTMYVIAGDRGPELTFVAQREINIPRLSIYLEDDFTELPADVTDPESVADTPLGSNTRYSKHVSYSFSISDVSLPAGQSIGVGVDRTLKQFYFADNDPASNRYTLNVIGRTKEEQVTETETREDLPNGEFEITTATERLTRRYEESLQIRGVEVESQTFAYFDYGNWAQIPTSDAELAEFTTAVDVPIAYNSLPDIPAAGPLSLNPQSADTQATQTRLYRGNLIKSNYR
ncbi:MAG: hypothetical protein ACFBSF_03545 [Leptolyngbyaceae cyanobacterium]